MGRGIFTTAVVLAVSAWAGAQGPSPLSADEHHKLLRANRLLLDDLVESGVKLADADTARQRAEAARDAARRLSRELTTAVAAENADRVAEMGDHLDALLRDGLTPAIRTAHDQIPPDSAEAKRLKELYNGVLVELDATRGAVPTAGKVGDSGKVKAARGRLAEARDALGRLAADWK